MNRIPYHRAASVDAYQRVQQAQQTRPATRPDAVDAAKQAEQATPAAAARRTPSFPGLNAEESAAVDRHFPAESKGGLRLYGRHGVETVQPSRVGSRLDLSA